MVIELNFKELFDRMRAVSHREVAEIPDAEARYRAEAGTEKTDDLERCLVDASARLASRLMRFLLQRDIDYVDNEHTRPNSFTYELSLSERRSINKAEPLKEACNTFLLEYALSEFYSIVSQGELSNKHSLKALEAGDHINELLFFKLPPQV